MVVVQQATETEESRQAVDGESCRRVAAAIPGTVSGDVNEVSDAKRGAYQAREKNHRSVYARLGARVARIRVRTLGLVGGLAVLVVGLVMALTFLRPDERDDAAPAAAPSAPPVANANGQPIPGPTPASPPVAEAQTSSRFGLNAQKLLDEVRSHGITFSDGDAAKLVQIGDANVARNQPDLTADDLQIRRQLTQEFPSLTDDQAKIETSCLAEYVEREIARQHHTVPPDESDDHG